MTIERLLELKNDAEKRCTEQFNIVEEAKATLERIRGEFHAFDFAVNEVSQLKPEESKTPVSPVDKSSSPQKTPSA
jgi:hypothetical protein